MFSLKNRPNAQAWLTLAAFALATGIVSAAAFYVASSGNNEITSRERIPAGTVQNVSIASGFWENTTAMQLDSGKIVILNGTINPWQPGEAVSQPVIYKGDSDSFKARLKKIWCVGDKCLSQI